MATSSAAGDMGIAGVPCMDDDDYDSGRNSNRMAAAAAASLWAGTIIQSTKHSIQALTARKFSLPDKNVASQVLMYRQLLHTSCRPNLVLSRDYQGTPAQKAVLHMPWWSQGIEETKKMVISYQNLLARLWVAGACEPYEETWQQYHSSDTVCTKEETSLTNQGDRLDEKQDMNRSMGADFACMSWEKAKFRAPVPHAHWVSRLGFQQEDPVTDFRSGGILSLAMMVYITESCPDTYRRFILDGDAAVLPFALTCINITSMMAKFLMLSKSVDRMDALLSQKPFWRMFADPNAMLVCQEVAMRLTAQVVVELQNERGPDKKVTVFDFASILQVVEQRMEYDHLMAGPTSSDDLLRIHAQNAQKYKAQSQHRQAMQMFDDRDKNGAQQGMTLSAPPTLAANAQQERLSLWRSKATQMADSMSSVAGNMWGGLSKIRSPASVDNNTAAAPDLLSSFSCPPALYVPTEQPPMTAGAVEDSEDVML